MFFSAGFRHDGPMQKTLATIALSSALILLAVAAVTVFGHATHQAWAQTAESVAQDSMAA